MAVEAHHLHLFSPQLVPNRNIVHTIKDKPNLSNTQMGFLFTENLIPFYPCPIADSLPAVTTTNNAADSGLTCNFSSTPNERVREFDLSPGERNQSSILSSYPPFSFLGEDISIQIQQQQSEIHRFITQHMEKTRMDLAETRQRHAKRIFAVVEQGMIKRLKATEEEIEKIGRLNWALEERVKSLSVENQIWRDLARSNEATANALRANLEQVLAQVSNEKQQQQQQHELADDAESCCDSTKGEEEEEEVDRRYGDEGGEEMMRKKRSCRNCGEEEACVLLLPCRHLCLCTKCGGSRLLHACPVCKVNMTGSVHVNIS